MVTLINSPHAHYQKSREKRTLLYHSPVLLFTTIISFPCFANPNTPINETLIPPTSSSLFSPYKLSTNCHLCLFNSHPITPSTTTNRFFPDETSMATIQCMMCIHETCSYGRGTITRTLISNFSITPSPKKPPPKTKAVKDARK